MRVRVRHQSRYHYSEPALLGPQLVRLHPAAHARATLLSYDLRIDPECAIRWQQDPSGNRIARASFPAERPTRELGIAVELSLEVRPLNPFDFFVEDFAKEIPFRYPAALAAELMPYAAMPALGARTRELVASLPDRGYVTEWLVELNRTIAREVRYVIRDEAGIQTCEETLIKGSGSCRDSARLLVDVLRARGLAARFVSGYLIQLADEGDIPGEARGVTRDVVDLHAWAEVFVPGAGWLGLDGTSGLLCGEGHVPLACTAEPALAAPIEGTASQPSTLSFAMDIARLGFEPSPKRPYTDEQWTALLEAGDRVDTALAKCGIVLTMGGEPTWVSRDHPDEKEWNTDALGPTKWTAGIAMAREIAKRFGRGALTLQRMGKHYPGESLPRWALHVIWRRDGEPIWHDASRLALPAPGLLRSESADRIAIRGAPMPGAPIAIGDAPRMSGAPIPIGGPAMSGVREAQELARAIARRLGLEAIDPIAAYEDPWAHLVEEQNLPIDVDPLRVDLGDPEQRRTLARALGRGLGAPVGYAIPLGREDGRWIASRWTFRRGAMFLVPGDSPIGLRLPLDRIQGSPRVSFGRDPSAASTYLPLAPRIQRAGEARAAAIVEDGVLRTALCTEVRNGVMHVFVPPMPCTEDFLELVATIEDAAVERGHAVRIEGYPPPSDPRLGHCVVTPDPGVLEVNAPVTERFRDYAAMIETLSDAARHAGLTTLKLHLDGREHGTGGGHHLTLGGPSPDSSPFLRRPDLLGSLLRYVQNHPSLSYLFTGLFVGPTSQAPRLDEARHDALYELELALARVPRAGSSDRPIPPWLVDRLFRNLLADVSGNTHRTEICIDKLWDPQTSAGRQGLLELRAFEMPPHERMAVAQMLLVRSIAARAALAPYERPLIRWGSELHDRFMLPHYLWRDLEDVIADLEAHGVGLDPAWYRPFLELRCPLLGSIAIGEVTIELRAAIEPWPVLGEELVSGGTARHVDSSLERLEVRVDGVIEGRHAIAVNGLALPMRPTGRAGERVAGVRYRAWQPPYCLQPTIGIHHPLRFDLVDTWGKRSLGACTYHVWHPEGRAYDRAPLTIAEAAARRASRFTTIGHAPSPCVPFETKPHPEQPYTLDLRRYPIDRRPPAAS